MLTGSETGPLETPARERREIRFAGRVQGVGFRDSTRRIANSHPVTGFVQNLSDGRVLLVVEGEPGELDRFLADIDRCMNRNITSRQVKTQSARGEFESFTVAY